ncbi:MAG: peroxiredoxin-like family protein [Balneolaceae bacterium]
MSCSQSAQTEKDDYPQNAMDIKPLLVGMQVPDVVLKDTNNKNVRLIDEVRKKPTAIIFYRGGWCPFCNEHLVELREIENELYDLGINIFAISPDSPQFLSETLADQEIGYHLLSDQKMECAQKFGVAFQLDSETVERYKANGLDLVKRSGYDHHLLPVPAVFLVDTDGVIQFQYVNPDFKVRISSEVLLAAAADLVNNRSRASM